MLFKVFKLARFLLEAKGVLETLFSKLFDFGEFGLFIIELLGVESEEFVVDEFKLE